MNVKKLIKYTSIILIAVLLVTFSTSCKTNREPPTVKLEIYEGPEYTTGFCVYRIEAVVTGYPEPEVTFSRNDGSLGENRCQVNLESSQEPYLLEATAENSMGEATASLLLEWGCEEETEEIVEEQEKFYKNVELITEVNSRIFPIGWTNHPDIDPKATSLSPDEYERTEGVLLNGLQKNPDRVIEEYLAKIYALGSLELYGEKTAGTYFPLWKCIYIVNNGIENDSTGCGFENLFYEELSSLLYYGNKSLLDEQTWETINPSGFEYGKTNSRSQKFSSQLNEMGFLYEYAQTNLENDFNSFAGELFLDFEPCWNAVKKYDKLKQKLDLTSKFYIEIDKDYEPFIKSQYEKYGLEWTLD